MLQWRLILEEQGPDIEYIQGAKNTAADVLSQSTTNENQEIIHESIYTTEKMSELYDIQELLEGMFTISFKIVDRYPWEYPILMEKLISEEYIKVFFRGIWNTIHLVTFT